MKKIGTLGYLILGLITTSAFAQTAPSPEVSPTTESAQTAQPSKPHKKGGRKHSHRAHKKHHKKPAAEQK